jgi:hypothetical protein
MPALFKNLKIFISATSFKTLELRLFYLVSYIVVIYVQSIIELLRFHYRTAVSKPTS